MKESDKLVSIRVRNWRVVLKMVKQVIIWKLQDKCFGPNLGAIKESIKTRLEDLNGKIPGLENIDVRTECLSSSNGDVAAMALFESEEAFKNYQKHELRLAATKDVVVPFVDSATHVEFEV